MSILFITGSDTDVGKTVASLLALRVLAPHGAIYLKPVQTGCTDPAHGSDAAFLAAHLPGGLPQGMTPAQATGVCRPAPKAPLFAGAPVAPSELLDFVASHAGRHPITVVEGAGGILVPVTPTWTMLDFARDLGATVLVVGRANLGTINHTVLTLRTVADAGLTCLGAVLMNPHNAASAEERAENSQAIEQLSNQRVWGVIDHINPRAPKASALAVMTAALAPFLPSGRN
ncbi:MAG: dethiobiotin synthase [Opitutae bacterium]|nr:dethiobiotin synthase [Opitutae bacterium]